MYKRQILVTSQVQNLPITILSRCQQVQFNILPSAVIQDILQRLHPERQSQIGLAAALSQGSVSTAEVLLANEEIAAARQDFYRLLNQLEQLNPADIILWCEQWDKNKKMVRSLLELAQLWYLSLIHI